VSPRVRTVLDLVSEMTPDERAELRETLAEAFNDDEWTAAWNDELTRRVAQVERGEVTLLTEEGFFDDGE
jgi:hypothetical protein